MELTYLLDTNILISMLRYRMDALGPRLRAASGQVAVSMISVAELEHGVARSSQPDSDGRRVESLLSFVDVLPFDRAAAHYAGRISAYLATSGMSIGPYDALIAGHARSRGLVVVTANMREFARVPGLECEDWTTSG